LRYIIDETERYDIWVDKMDSRRTGKLMEQRVDEMKDDETENS
jgi:hypothetical protein